MTLISQSNVLSFLEHSMAMNKKKNDTKHSYCIYIHSLMNRKLNEQPLFAFNTFINSIY